MSTAVSCTRAIVPRVTCRAPMCRRYASTEAIAVESAGAATLFTPQRPKKKPEPLSMEMHRKIYPHLYDSIDAVNWQPQKKVNRYQRRPPPRRIDPKWATVMRAQGVSKQMSSRFGVPVFVPQTLNIKKTCPDPVKAVTASQTSLLDPSAARTRLFAKDNPECARVGDILLVRQRTGDPFAGVCINIRRRGIDTAILLRGQLTRVGVEMWYKIYSPLVEGIEVVQRAAKRARRARLTYMRTAKHDRGSVENVVRIYLRQKAAFGMADGGKKKSTEAAAAAMGGTKKKGKGRGKKR